MGKTQSISSNREIQIIKAEKSLMILCSKDFFWKIRE